MWSIMFWPSLPDIPAEMAKCIFLNINYKIVTTKILYFNFHCQFSKFPSTFSKYQTKFREKNVLV